MHSHEDLLTAFSLSADLLLRSRLYALAERKVLLKRNTIGEAVNRRSPKNAFSEAASIFVLRLLLWGLKGASSPFLATATTAACGGNREELLGPRSAGHECRPRHEVDAGYRNPSGPARRNRGRFSGSLLARKREPYSAFFKNSGNFFSISASAFPRWLMASFSSGVSWA